MVTTSAHVDPHVIVCCYVVTTTVHVDPHEKIIKEVFMQSNFGTLADFAKEIEACDNKKHDVIASQNAIRMLNDNSIAIENDGEYAMLGNAHSQFATDLEIPKRYYDKIGDIPGLRTLNVNALLRQNPERKRFLRTWKEEDSGVMRANLSDQFRPYDHTLYLSAAFPVLKEFQNLEVKSYSLTDIRFYLQVIIPSFTEDIRPGETVGFGATFSNSEVGRGYYDMLKTLWFYVCGNGQIGQSILRKRHVGSRIETNGDDMLIYSDDTITADIEALRLKIRDTMKNFLTEETFAGEIEKLRAATEDGISKRKVQKVIENVTKRYNMLGDNDQEGILGNLIDSGDLTRYGLANAVTALAHDLEGKQDKQYDVERAGQMIIELKPTEWQVLSAA